MECPICKAKAQKLESGFFDGYALKCLTHGEIEFTDTVQSTRMNEPRDAWERAHTNARTRAVKATGTLGEKRPRITDRDF